MKKYRVFKTTDGQFFVMRFLEAINGCDKWTFLTLLGGHTPNKTLFESMRYAQIAIDGNKYKEESGALKPSDTCVLETD